MPEPTGIRARLLRAWRWHITVRPAPGLLAGACWLAFTAWLTEDRTHALQAAVTIATGICAGALIALAVYVLVQRRARRRTISKEKPRA